MWPHGRTAACSSVWATHIAWTYTGARAFAAGLLLPFLCRWTGNGQQQALAAPTQHPGAEAEVAIYCSKKGCHPLSPPGGRVEQEPVWFLLTCSWGCAPSSELPLTQDWGLQCNPQCSQIHYRHFKSKRHVSTSGSLHDMGILPAPWVIDTWGVTFLAIILIMYHNPFWVKMRLRQGSITYRKFNFSHMLHGLGRQFKV